MENNYAKKMPKYNIVIKHRDGTKFPPGPKSSTGEETDYMQVGAVWDNNGLLSLSFNKEFRLGPGDSSKYFFNLYAPRLRNTQDETQKYHGRVMLEEPGEDDIPF